MSKWLDIWSISYGDFARFRFDISLGRISSIAQPHYLPLLMVLNKSLNRLMTHYVQLPSCREVIGNIKCQQFAIVLTFMLVLGDNCINRYGYDAVRYIVTWLFSSTIFAIYTHSIANGESSVVFSWSWKSDLLLSCVLHIIIAKPLI